MSIKLKRSFPRLKIHLPCCSVLTAKSSQAPTRYLIFTRAEVYNESQYSKRVVAEQTYLAITNLTGLNWTGK